MLLTLIAVCCKVAECSSCGAMVHHVSLGQKSYGIKEFEDGVAGLVN